MFIVQGNGIGDPCSNPRQFPLMRTGLFSHIKATSLEEEEKKIEG